MGRPPAYIFVVRHGKRLDAADRQWHLSSPTPYDPPLTYGGWLQSKTVGARIASILEEREAEDNAAAEASTNDNQSQRKRKKKRYRIIIHSSPFLRCVQSSIAISAGLASSPFPSISHVSTNTQGAPPPESNSQGASQVSPYLNLTQRRLTVSTNVASHTIPKSVLRLDSFLGEWLSPDYFEHITPPPRSMLMLATAKAELLRREDYNEYPHFHAGHSPYLTGQLWSATSGPAHRAGSPLAFSVTPSLSTLPSIDDLPNLNDSLSVHNGNAAPHGEHPHHPREHRGYMSPVPSYAISSSQPIPRGYVAHARDACVDIDYQWDSTRDNLGWGDGGVLPEEWASMHQRFRRGLRRLVEWYTTTENPGEMVTKTPTSATKSSPKATTNHGKPAAEDSEDIEIENVVILVSHGAGCNALVGAITQQPVLADVAMSSLTMAQRRPEFDQGVQGCDFDKPLSSLDEGLSKKWPNPSDMFELKLFANTDHLISTLPRNMTVGRSVSLTAPHGASAGLFSGAYTSALGDINFGDAYGGSPGGESRRNSANASLGSIRRAPQGPTPAIRPLNYTRPNISGGVTVGSGATNLLTHRNRSGSVGLWQPPQEREPEPEKADAPMLLNFSHEKEAAKEAEKAAVKTEAGQQQERNKNGDTAEVPSIVLPRRKTEEAAATRQDSRDSLKAEEERDTFEDDVAVPHLWAGTGNGGLWGAPRPPGEAERLRDFSSMKRRWTVNEREVLGTAGSQR